MADFKTTLNKIKAKNLVITDDIDITTTKAPLQRLKETDIVAATGSTNISDPQTAGNHVIRADLLSNSIDLTITAPTASFTEDCLVVTWIHLKGGDGTKTLTLTNGTNVAGLGQVFTPAASEEYIIPLLFVGIGSSHSYLALVGTTLP